MARSSSRGRLDPELGATIVEVLVVLVVVAVLACMVVPASATVLDAGRARHAAGFIHSRFRLARIEAVNTGAHVGVVFDYAQGGWTFRVCRDATRDGLRRADIRSGADPCFDGPHDFRAMFPGVEIAVDPLLAGPAGEPGNPDPVRFGTPDLISFSPAGSCTSGSIFLRSARGQQYALRVAGINGRSRLFRFEAGARTWLQL